MRFQLVQSRVRKRGQALRPRVGGFAFAVNKPAAHRIIFVLQQHVIFAIEQFEDHRVGVRRVVTPPVKDEIRGTNEHGFSKLNRIRNTGFFQQTKQSSWLTGIRLPAEQSAHDGPVRAVALACGTQGAVQMNFHALAAVGYIGRELLKLL